MTITPIQSGTATGYRASYKHKGVQIVEFAPTATEALNLVLNHLKTPPCGHPNCIYDVCINDIPF